MKGLLSEDQVFRLLAWPPEDSRCDDLRQRFDGLDLRFREEEGKPCPWEIIERERIQYLHFKFYSDAQSAYPTYFSYFSPIEPGGGGWEQEENGLWYNLYFISL